MGEKVLVAEKISDAGLRLLETRCEVDVAVGVDPSGLRRRIAEAAGLVVRSGTEVDAALIGAAPRLRVIGRAGIGVDNIDLEAATDAGVLVVNAPTANTISAAEHTMALLLAQARGVPAADASLRAGRWERSEFEGVELHGKTLAILGLGRIGTLVAQRASAFGMRILAFDPYVSEERARRIGARLGELDDVLAQADFVTIHLPRSRETEGMIDGDLIRSMKPGVRIVNVARGGIVDEDALAAAVQTGHVGGAALDVFSVEPATSNPLFELPQVVVTPHLGGSTREAQDKAGLAVAEAMLAALDGELVASAVNLDFGVQISPEVKPFLRLAEQLGAIFTALGPGLPAELTVAIYGQLADHPVRPFALGALKGALTPVTDENVSYVNATRIARQHGLASREATVAAIEDYQSLLRISGTVAGSMRSVAGTHMARKGPTLVEVDDYEIEFPLSGYMLIVRNDDVPGLIGAVGSVLGRAGVNIADMAVGRHADGSALMGLALDNPVPVGVMAELGAIDGVAESRFVEL